MGGVGVVSVLHSELVSSFLINPSTELSWVHGPDGRSIMSVNPVVTLNTIVSSSSVPFQRRGGEPPGVDAFRWFVVYFSGYSYRDRPLPSVGM